MRGHFASARMPSAPRTPGSDAHLAASSKSWVIRRTTVGAFADADRRPGNDVCRVGTSATPRFCLLHELLGRVESCAGSACGLWEQADATHAGGCAVADLDLTGRPEASAWLLRIRQALENASTPEELAAARRRLVESRDLITRTSLAARRH
jgi:hypothetical protein